VQTDNTLCIPLTRCLVSVVSQVQVAVDKRTVDTTHLIRIAGGRVLCAASDKILESASWKVATALNGRIRRFYSAHIFHSVARLDVPTWDDPVVYAQIDTVIPKDSNTIAWAAIACLMQTASTLVTLFSQTAVLIGVLREQRDGLLLALLSFASDAFTCFNFTFTGDIGGGERLPLLSVIVDSHLSFSLAWAATTHNSDYIRMEGLKILVGKSKHRKELVAGGLAAYLTAGMSYPSPR
jgi:hypothetical protein